MMMESAWQGLSEQISQLVGGSDVRQVYQTITQLGPDEVAINFNVLRSFMED